MFNINLHYVLVQHNDEECLRFQLALNHDLVVYHVPISYLFSPGGSVRMRLRDTLTNRMGLNLSHLPMFQKFLDEASKELTGYYKKESA